MRLARLGLAVWRRVCGRGRRTFCKLTVTHASGLGEKIVLRGSYVALAWVLSLLFAPHFGYTLTSTGGYGRFVVPTIATLASMRLDVQIAQKRCTSIVSLSRRHLLTIVSRDANSARKAGADTRLKTRPEGVFSCCSCASSSSISCPRPSFTSPPSLGSWDSYLIRTLQRCPSFKPVLTTYPAGYELPHKIPAGETRPTLLVPDGFGRDGMLRQTGRLLVRTASEPLPSPLWASGFSFSGSALLLEVSRAIGGTGWLLYVPQHLFLGLGGLGYLPSPVIPFPACVFCPVE